MTIEKRIERLEAILDARGLDWDHPRVASDHFADADKMVAEEPPKKWRILKPDEVVQEGDWVNAKSNNPDEDPPGGGWVPARASVIGGEASQAMGLYVARPVAEELAKEASLGVLLDLRTFAQPNLRWRILEPGEVVCSSDWICARSNLPSDPPNGRGWKPQIFSTGISVSKDDECIFARPVTDEPAKEPEPAWEPKVGDWVKVTRPESWKELADPYLAPQMHQYVGKVGKIESEWEGRFHLCGFALPNKLRLIFDRDWLTPAEPPEPEYREPVLPADAGKVCEFSDDGQGWLSGWVYGWVPGRNWVTLNNNNWKHARIKKDA